MTGASPACSPLRTSTALGELNHATSDNVRCDQREQAEPVPLRNEQRRSRPFVPRTFAIWPVEIGIVHGRDGHFDVLPSREILAVGSKSYLIGILERRWPGGSSLAILAPQGAPVPQDDSQSEPTTPFAHSTAITIATSSSSSIPSPATSSIKGGEKHLR